MAKRFIPIKFKDENETILQFRLGPMALDLFQSVSNKKLTELTKDMGIKELVQLLYAGCYSMHHDLTIEKMWQLVDNFELDELNEVMEKLFPNQGETDPNEEM